MFTPMSPAVAGSWAAALMAFEEAMKDERIQKLERKIGEMVLDMDIMREAMKPYPLADRTSEE